MADLRGQLTEGLDHPRQTVGVFGTVARIEPGADAVFDDLKPEAVPLGLVQPIVAFGWANGCRGGEGADEGKTWHDLGRPPPFCYAPRLAMLGPRLHQSVPLFEQVAPLIGSVRFVFASMRQRGLANVVG